MTKLRPGVLLDRDGTIISNGKGYPGRPEDVEFLPGAPEAIRSFNEAGIPVALISNQGGIAHGFHSIDDVMETHEFIARELRAASAHIDLYLFCPYHPGGTVPAFTRHSEDRKPRPGMAIAAQTALDLNLSRSWVIGDRPEDMELARVIGAKAALVGAMDATSRDLYSFPDLAQAASFILGCIVL